MTRLNAFFDWLDNAAGGLIRFAYLAATLVASGVYFGAGHLPAAIENPLNALLPWSLAFAVETHTYITARRVRAAWQERNSAAMKVNLYILAGLLAFSAWNQINYLAETWQPPDTGVLILPHILAYIVRATIVPFAFMCAAFLAPMAEPIHAQIEAEARATLTDVFKIARKQRRKLLKKAEHDGVDMTGALIELVSDEKTRHVISHAYHAIGAPLALPASTTTTTAPVATTRVVSAARAVEVPSGAVTEHHLPPSSHKAMHDWYEDFPEDRAAITSIPGIPDDFDADSAATLRNPGEYGTTIVRRAAAVQSGPVGNATQQVSPAANSRVSAPVTDDVPADWDDDDRPSASGKRRKARRDPVWEKGDLRRTANNRNGSRTYVRNTINDILNSALEADEIAVTADGKIIGLSSRQVARLANDRFAEDSADVSIPHTRALEFMGAWVNDRRHREKLARDAAALTGWANN